MSRPSHHGVYSNSGRLAVQRWPTCVRWLSWHYVATGCLERLTDTSLHSKHALVALGMALSHYG